MTFYLLTPMLGEQNAAQVLAPEEIQRPFAETRQELMGTFEVDVDRVLAANHAHQIATQQRDRKIWASGGMGGESTNIQMGRGGERALALTA